MSEKEAGAPAAAAPDMAKQSDTQTRRQQGLISRLREQLLRYENQIRILQTQLRREAEARQTILNSTSWRITHPLRLIISRWRVKRPAPAEHVNTRAAGYAESEPATMTDKCAFERLSQIQLQAFLIRIHL